MKLEHTFMEDHDGLRVTKIGLIKGRYPMVCLENSTLLGEIRRRRSIIERNIQQWS